MSKLTEFLSLVPKAIRDPGKIVEGYLNAVKSEWGILSEDKQEEIVRRRLICNTCEFNSILAKQSKEYKELHGVNYDTERTDLHCSQCLCPIISKTASLESDCGLEDYNKEHPENVQELKWTKYKKI